MVKQISLYCKEGSSDKVYNVQLVKHGSGYLVNAQNGKRGGTLTPRTKTPTPVSLEEATKIYDKLVKSKMAKRYTEGETASGNTLPTDLGSSPTDTGMYPQLLTEIWERSEVMALINDDDYFMQEKRDGDNRMAKKSKKETIGINKKGFSVPLPQCIADSIPVVCELDGEIIGDLLYVFGIRSLKNKSLKKVWYLKRLLTLDTIKFGESITVVETAYTKAEKLAMFKRVEKEGGEGVVLKRKTGLHIDGRSDEQFKFKFWKTATCRVMDHTKGKRSVGLEMLDGDKVVRVGKATVYPNQEVPPVGAYVEIRYLYAYKKGSLYQPKYKSERNDQNETDIKLDQLKYKQGT